VRSGALCFDYRSPPGHHFRFARPVSLDYGGAMIMRAHFWMGLLLTVLVIASSGCRSTYYSAMEKVGVYKRDLLKKKVTAARDEEKQASQQFTNALNRLKQLYGFEGGNLEKTYRALENDYEKSAAQAGDVRVRVREVETVAKDLFAEWENELKDISSVTLRDRSRTQLRETRRKYDELYNALKRAEQSMEPVLVQFRDHVLFLKHNLNAQAIGSLRGEATSIQTDISRLLTEMNTAIARADEFIKALP
jgi:hypothetical protein